MSDTQEPASSAADPQKYRVKSLDRAIDILEFIAQSGIEGVSVSDVARANGTTKSNAYGILQTLVDRGYLADSGEGMTRRYRLGPAFLNMAVRASQQQPLSLVASEILAEVSRELGLPSRFAVLDGGYAVPLYRNDAPGLIQFAPYLGRRELPHCSGIGKALLSTLSDAEVEEIIAITGLPRRTERTLTTLDALLGDLRESRVRGYAFDDEEDNEGVFCVGAAVTGADGKVIGAISVSGLRQARTLDHLHVLGRKLRDKALAFSHRMGA